MQRWSALNSSKSIISLLFSNGKFHTQKSDQSYHRHTNKLHCSIIFSLWDQNYIPEILSSDILITTHYMFPFILWWKKLKFRMCTTCLRLSLTSSLGWDFKRGFPSRNPVMRSMQLPAATWRACGMSAIYCSMPCAPSTPTCCGIRSPFPDDSKWTVHKSVYKMYVLTISAHRLWVVDHYTLPSNFSEQSYLFASIQRRV